MPKSFLVKKKKARWSEEGGGEDAKLAGHETPDETRTLPEELKLEQEKLISEEEEDEEGETERLLSADREPEMADSPCKQNDTEDMCVDEKETKQHSYYKHDSPVQPSNSCEEFCWWTSISTRYELQKLPPPPKLISSVPRNGLAKMHHSTERQPVITLSQSHHFPLPGNGFGVVSFSDHRVPPVPESIPLRASLDGLREVSLNLRHPSDGHCESSALCGNVPQAIATPPPQLNGNHFFIHSHPFLTSHRQQECGIPTLQHKQSQNRKPGLEGDDTKYKCEICNSSFTLQRLLNRHMKTHSFYKRYHCQFCTKGFNDTFDLKRHIRTHTGIKPFKCSRCDKSFTQRCSLEAHLTRVHGILHKFGFRERRSKMFVCEDCGRTFTENSDFMKHLHELHPETEKIMRARRNGGFAPKMKDVS